MQLGKYFTLEEMIHSDTAIKRGIDNRPSPSQIASLGLLVAKVLDPLREAVGRPITVSSGFRNEALNKAVGGVPSSQHQAGEAADISISGYTIAQTIEKIQELKLPYDQVIDEFSRWVHVSYRPAPRGEALVARTDSSGRAVYSKLS